MGCKDCILFPAQTPALWPYHSFVFWAVDGVNHISLSEGQIISELMPA